MEKMHFFYSASQAEVLRENRAKRIFAKIGDKIVEYTEACHRKKPYGFWEDYVYLGEGTFSHIEK